MPEKKHNREALAGKYKFRYVINKIDFTIAF